MTDVPALNFLNPHNYSRFMMIVNMPMDQAFVRLLLQLAVTTPTAVPSWARVGKGVNREGPDVAFYLDEKDWDPKAPDYPPSHRLDLYAIVRGMSKVFDIKYPVTVEMRQRFLGTLFLQDQGEAVRQMLWASDLSYLVQLALFDQIIYPSLGR